MLARNRPNTWPSGSSSGAGVLVPSAMINQDCADLFFESDGRPPAREIRARLERIARGEEAQPGQSW